MPCALVPNTRVSTRISTRITTRGGIRAEGQSDCGGDAPIDPGEASAGHHDGVTGEGGCDIEVAR